MSDRHPTVVAVLPKAEDRRSVLDRAAEVGRDEGARVVLYDLSATGGPLESPLPTEFASDGPDRGVPPLLTVDDLEAAGQGALAAAVRSLGASGVEAYGWLPERSSAEDLATYARAVGATTVLAPPGGDIDPDDLPAAGFTVERVPSTAGGR
jgi:hypothetical protein